MIKFIQKIFNKSKNKTATINLPTPTTAYPAKITPEKQQTSTYKPEVTQNPDTDVQYPILQHQQQEQTAMQPEGLPSICNTHYPMQMQNDLRILNDSLSLIQKTTNLEIFFSRYELAIQKALTLQQAQQSGINVGKFIKSDKIAELKQPNLERILQATYQKEISAINGLKTAKGKLNRIDKFLTVLSNYNDDLQGIDKYNKIIKNLKKLKLEIKKEQKAVISEQYQAAYQASIADAERIKSNLEYLNTEKYQILGGPDCKHYKICAKHNDKVYPLSQHKIGVTAPPFHEQCTCTIVPYFDDEF